jgi:hypothetical protein
VGAVTFADTVGSLDVTTVSAVASAIAAGAAWRSVLQGQRLWRASQDPDLHPQVLLVAAHGTTAMSVMNVGSGIAKGAAFLLVADGKSTAGAIGDGFLPSGAKVMISAPMAADNNAECIVMYRSSDESAYFTDRAGPRNRLRKGRRSLGRRRLWIGPERSAKSVEDLWNRAYPGRPLDSLDPVGHEINWASQAN